MRCLSELAGGTIASPIIRTSDPRIQCALITSPRTHVPPTILWMGTIEIGVENWTFVWDALLMQPGLCFVCVGMEEGMELGHPRGTPEKRPMRDTSKPANEIRQDKVVITQGRTSRQRKSSQGSAMIGYSDSTWAEDMAPQGCDQSADPEAGMRGRRQAASAAFWRESGKSREREGRALASFQTAVYVSVSYRRFGAPTFRSALEHVSVMQQPVEHGADCGNVGQ